MVQCAGRNRAGHGLGTLNLQADFLCGLSDVDLRGAVVLDWALAMAASVVVSGSKPGCNRGSHGYAVSRPRGAAQRETQTAHPEGAATCGQNRARADYRYILRFRRIHSCGRISTSFVAQPWNAGFLVGADSFSRRLDDYVAGSEGECVRGTCGEASGRAQPNRGRSRSLQRGAAPN